MTPTTLPQTEGIVLVAILAVVLANLFFAFRVVPWGKPGPWRRVWILISIASMMLVLSQAAILAEPQLAAAAHAHQVPLFAALLAAVAGFFVVYSDAYRAAERARILALTDAVTQLPNRRAFEERLRAAYEGSDRFALVYLDLDGFKKVNDLLGHAAGDDLLRLSAGLLRQCVRKGDIAARLGGDEFALFLAGADAQSSQVVAQRVFTALGGVQLEQGLRVSASFGIATRADAPDAGAVVAAADAAMYRAKRSGGGIAVAQAERAGSGSAA